MATETYPNEEMESYDLSVTADNHTKRGIAIVIVNRFKDRPGVERCGAKSEEENFVNMFNAMNVDVHVYRDCTLQQLKDILAIIEKTKEPTPTFLNLPECQLCKKNPNCHSVNVEPKLFWLCFASHGCEEAIFMNDGQKMNFKEIIYKFRGCTALDGIPKIVLFNCCRITADQISSSDLENLETARSTVRPPKITTDSLIKEEKIPSIIVSETCDLLILYSCAERTASARYSHAGSPVILQFSDYYCRMRELQDIRDIIMILRKKIMIEINKMCKDNSEHKNKTQTIWEMNSLIKKLILPPAIVAVPAEVEEPSLNQQQEKEIEHVEKKEDTKKEEMKVVQKKRKLNVSIDNLYGNMPKKQKQSN